MGCVGTDGGRDVEGATIIAGGYISNLYQRK